MLARHMALGTHAHESSSIFLGSFGLSLFGLGAPREVDNGNDEEAWRVSETCPKGSQLEGLPVRVVQDTGERIVPGQERGQNTKDATGLEKLWLRAAG